MNVLAPPRRLSICYHPDVRGAEPLARRLAEMARECSAEAWVDELPDAVNGRIAETIAARLADADLMVCVGGDGTVLHASAHAAVAGVPIFGVRMGRLGFLTEVTEAEAEQRLAQVLEHGARLERRSMVQARVGDAEPVHALNDVVIGRATLGRTVSVMARVDGVLLAEYRADAIVISTATGSTGYSLSVNGPILHPGSEDVILVPVAPHLTRSNALVLPGSARVRLSVVRGHAARLTVDGMNEQPIESGAVVEVSNSPRHVDFVRLGGEQAFYAHLAQRLGWLRLDHVLDDGEVTIDVRDVSDAP